MRRVDKELPATKAADMIVKVLAEYGLDIKRHIVCFISLEFNKYTSNPLQFLFFSHSYLLNSNEYANIQSQSLGNMLHIIHSLLKETTNILVNA